MDGVIGAETYEDASKDTWRGWKWNAIARAALGFNARLPPSEQKRMLATKTVLYLVGPNDRDRQKAIDIGFLADNLIAVDLLQERVDAVRKSGGLAIRGSLQMILSNWPKDWPIDVIDGDFCSGLVSDIVVIRGSMGYCAAMHPLTVVSLNLMRGRDPSSNSIRAEIGRTPNLLAKLFPKERSPIKHRGVNWLAHVCSHHFKHFGDGYFADLDEMADWIHKTFKPNLHSYRSKTSGQFFDSIVHHWGADGVDYGRQNRGVIRQAMVDALSVQAGNDDGMRGRIAALRAVRTRRIGAAA